MNEVLGVSTGGGSGGTLRDGGSVVMMSSINGIAGAFGQTNYAFTKAALMRYTAELSALQSVSGRGVSVAAIAPGFIETK
jgi:3-oxoacyl-[acyl-carrier protein] reductase